LIKIGEVHIEKYFISENQTAIPKNSITDSYLHDALLKKYT